MSRQFELVMEELGQKENIYLNNHTEAFDKRLTKWLVQ